MLGMYQFIDSHRNTHFVCQRKMAKNQKSFLLLSLVMNEKPYQTKIRYKRREKTNVNIH